MPPRLAPPEMDRGSRLFFEGVDWTGYTYFLKLFAESPAVRLTYDRGALEIMSPSLPHDDQSRIFAYFVQALTEEWGLPLKVGGSVTMRRRAKQAGLEADESFWMTSAARMAGRRSLDLRRDPPPDLAVEIEISKARVNRMALYARLGVPEVWRLGKKGLAFHALANKKYEPVETSRAFPGLRPTFLMEFLEKAALVPDVNPLLREFRAAARRLRPRS